MLQRIRSLVRAAWRRADFERDMDDEVRFHLESRAADLVRRGVPPAEAARRARVEFGNAAVYRDRCRDARRLTLIDDAAIDLRFALRAMRKDALVTATIVGTLAIGIGATAAVFTAVNAALLRPLPFPNPSQLVIVSGEGDIQAVAGPDFVEWQAGCRDCAGVAAFMQWPSTIAGGAGPERVLVGRVTPGFFNTLGRQPMLGRTFLPEEVPHSRSGSMDGSRRNVAVILSAALWRRQFQADPAIVGRTVRVDGSPTSVVGVMPDGFAFPDRADAWVPADVPATRGNATLRVIARLAPGVSLAQGAAALQTVAARNEAAQPDERRIRRIRLVPLQEYLVGDVRTSLTIFLAAVGLVLLIACANVANLLLAQAATRPREIAIRSILGAGRQRLLRQLLTESLLLAGGGGAAGLVLTVWLLQVFRGALPESVPRLNAIAVDGTVVLFVVLLSLGAGLLFGLAPAWRTASTDLNAALKDGARRGAGGPARSRVHGALVVTEVCLAMVLLIGAALLLESFVTLRTRPLGFIPEGVVTANVTLPEVDYETAAQRKGFFRDALARLQRHDELDAVALVSALPLDRHGAHIRGDVVVDGEAKERPGAFPAKIAIGGDYFRAMGIPLLEGRVLDARDDARAHGVVVISQSLARHLWPQQTAIGHRLDTGFGADTWAEVVGVVGDVKQDGLRQEVSHAVYHPFEQIADRRQWLVGEMTLVAKAPAAAAVQAFRTTVQQIDRNVPLYDVATMPQVVSGNVADPRFYALLMGSFSFVALVLAMAGIYGVVSYSARQRTHELGVRVALGARRSHILALVLREGLVLAAAGAALGLAGAYAATRTLTTFLFGVTVTDRATFAAVPLLVCLVALVASYVPARRATGADPLRALKCE